MLVVIKYHVLKIRRGDSALAYTSISIIESVDSIRRDGPDIIYILCNTLQTPSVSKQVDSRDF